MNIVVVDSAHLAGEADFPMPALDKFGWQQYPELTPEEAAEHCWRADIIISVDTPIDSKIIDKAFKLKLIVAASDDVSHIDRDAARARGITVCHVPGADPGDPAAGETICTQVIENINAYLSGEAIHCAD